jgi:hypothetical protein
MSWDKTAYVLAAGAAFAVVGAFLAGFVAYGSLVYYYATDDGLTAIAALWYGLVAAPIAGAFGLVVGWRTRQ